MVTVNFASLMSGPGPAYCMIRHPPPRSRIGLTGRYRHPAFAHTYLPRGADSSLLALAR